MKHERQKRGVLAACVVTLALLALIRVPVVVSAQGSARTSRNTVMAVPSWHLAGMGLHLNIECDAPSSCAVARVLWQAFAPFISGNGE